MIKRNVVEFYKCNIEQKMQVTKEYLKRILQQNSSKIKMKLYVVRHIKHMWKQYVVRNINICGKKI